MLGGLLVRGTVESHSSIGEGLGKEVGDCSRWRFLVGVQSMPLSSRARLRGLTDFGCDGALVEALLGRLVGRRTSESPSSTREGVGEEASDCSRW